MNALLAALIALLSLVATSDTSLVPAGPTKKLAKAPGYLKGRLLGSLVRKGMTIQQVTQVVHGECAVFCFPPGFYADNPSTMFFCYQNEGLTISFSSDKDGECYVDAVTFWPFWDDTVAAFGGRIR
jgi:hypothetical protein